MSNDTNTIAIQALYQRLLHRNPEREAVDNALRFLESGKHISDLETLILESEEYKARPPAHPLEQYTFLYHPHLTPFFSHRDVYRPLALTIETVNICNNDCVICPYSSQTRKRGTMSLDLFEKIIRDYVSIGGGPLSLTPMVGEVFLDKRLRDRLVYLQDVPSITEVSAITNATMVQRLGEEQLFEFAQLFDRLTVSIYGLDDEEFRIMTRKAEYPAFREGLRRLLKAFGPERLQLSARLLKQRSDEEIERWIATLAADAGVDRSKLVFGATSTFSNWSFFDTNAQLPFAGEWKAVATNVRQCALPLMSMQVYSNGQVSFCGCADFDASTELMLGDLNEESLRDILRKERIRALWDWQRHGVPSFCKNCSFHVPLEEAPASRAVFENPFKAFGG